MISHYSHFPVLLPFAAAVFRFSRHYNTSQSDFDPSADLEVVEVTTSVPTLADFLAWNASVSALPPGVFVQSLLVIV
jgi:hypothetical protein